MVYEGKYWECHNTLYTNQKGIQEGWASMDNLKKFAIDVGLDANLFNKCLDSGTYSDRVYNNKQIEISQGVEGIPVFILVGSDGTTQRIDGPQSSSIFADVIDSMLKKAMAEPVKNNTMKDVSATGMLSDGTKVSVWTSMPTAGEAMEISIEFEDAEHVNHDIM
ncbi:MAG: DsbA family protein, partial [Nitrosopumilus sp.]|nr:DsbA family protein [Nitrosopumilus sp.]MDH3517032.1 DsbA family protein [Nitrosopumilus sp.]MDH3565637.1 DsbA family protein [Nitrosopumilus sp.]MDH5417366.1 DsbA family protein [Nitrosopumilus sp.]MDH5555189.1 DsbA family protein [Nitrosopumilus sp.]